MDTNKGRVVNSKKNKIVSEEERWQMVAAVACAKAEDRGFDNFSPEVDPQRDWFEAGEEVDLYIANS